MDERSRKRSLRQTWAFEWSMYKRAGRAVVSKEHLVGWIVAAATAAGTCGAYWYMRGRENALIELKAILVGALAGLLVLVARFFWNLAFAASEIHEETIQERDRLAGELEGRRGLKFRFRGVSTGELTFEDANKNVYLLPGLSLTIAGEIRNYGVPNAITDWQAEVLIPGREPVVATPRYDTEAQRYIHAGRVGRLDPAESLYERTLGTIPTGVITGHLIFHIPQVQQQEITGAIVRVRFTDMYDNSYAEEYRAGSVRPGLVPRIPGMRGPGEVEG